MSIIVTTTGPELDSPVDPRFGRAAYFLVVDPISSDCRAHPNPALMPQEVPVRWRLSCVQPGGGGRQRRLRTERFPGAGGRGDRHVVARAGGDRPPGRRGISGWPAGAATCPPVRAGVVELAPKLCAADCRSKRQGNRQDHHRRQPRSEPGSRRAPPLFLDCDVEAPKRASGSSARHTTGARTWPSSFHG
jgi:hypothetical protein